MAKRIRGQRSSHRPGGQGPGRPSRDGRDGREGRDGRTLPLGTPAQGETEVLAQAPASRPSVAAAPERASPSATQARPSSRAEAAPAPRVSRTRGRVKADSLASRAAAEEVYVTDDLRRIGIVSAVMLSVLVVVWLLLAVIDPFSVY